MKKINLYSHHHRFNYLLKSNILQNSVNLVGKSPVDKTALFVSDDFAAVIEYTDGAMEIQGQESTSFAKMTISKIEKSGIDIKNKKKFYFRPLYSETLSKSLIEMLSEEGWQFKSLMPWSFYAGNYHYFLDNRFELREVAFKKKEKKDFLFLGNLEQQINPCKVDTSFGTKYPVIHCDIVENLTKDNFIDYPSRKERIANFEKANSCKVDIATNVNQGIQCFNLMSNYNLLVQPHGVCLRHNIYEGMCLGIPSIVEKTSYNKELFSIFPMSEFKEKEEKETKEIISKILYDDVYRLEFQKKLIDFFESNMTPDSIISLLFKQILDV